MNASAQDNVCVGSLCDGQNDSGTCACTNPSNQKRWLVSMTILCDELAPNTRAGVQLTSERTSRVFFDAETLSWPLANHWKDALDLHTAV